MQKSKKIFYVLPLLFIAGHFCLQIWLPIRYLVRDRNVDHDNRYAWTMFDGHEPSGIGLIAYNGEQTFQIKRDSTSHSNYRSFENWRTMTCARLELLGYYDYFLESSYTFLPAYMKAYIGRRKMCPERNFEKELKKPNQ